MSESACLLDREVVVGDEFSAKWFCKHVAKGGTESIVPFEKLDLILKAVFPRMKDADEMAIVELISEAEMLCGRSRKALTVLYKLKVVTDQRIAFQCQVKEDSSEEIMKQDGNS